MLTEVVHKILEELETTVSRPIEGNSIIIFQTIRLYIKSRKIATNVHNIVKINNRLIES